MTRSTSMIEVDGARVELRRSTRRHRSVQARMEGDQVVLLAPAEMGDAEAAQVVRQLLPRLVARQANREDPDALRRRAERLNRQYLAGRAVPSEIRWVPPMTSRWASCTPSTRVIRISETLRHVPAYVLDAVVLHELAHLLERGHGPRFKALVSRDPELDRANAYLSGLSRGLRLDIGELGTEETEADGKED